jgi:hypothetical protein
MKLLIPVMLLFLCFDGKSQDDLQFSVLTDEGIFTVSKSKYGKDMIRFGVHAWDKFTQGTTFSSRHLQINCEKRIFIRIASRYSECCNAGIGFCELYKEMPSLNAVDSVRIAEVQLVKIDGYTVQLIFLTEVDWQQLQENKFIRAINPEQGTNNLL